ncbi:MAG: hypothetical protein HC829_00020 [Bacteroidales bacterium]|nr:hypothetical protein [Bacteroidales bacterium]
MVIWRLRKDLFAASKGGCNFLAAPAVLDVGFAHIESAGRVDSHWNK